MKAARFGEPKPIGQQSEYALLKKRINFHQRQADRWLKQFNTVARRKAGAVAGYAVKDFARYAAGDFISKADHCFAEYCQAMCELNVVEVRRLELQLEEKTFVGAVGELK